MVSVRICDPWEKSSRVAWLALRGNVVLFYGSQHLLGYLADRRESGGLVLQRLLQNVWAYRPLPKFWSLWLTA